MAVYGLPSPPVWVKDVSDSWVAAGMAVEESGSSTMPLPGAGAALAALVFSEGDGTTAALPGRFLGILMAVPEPAGTVGPPAVPEAPPPEPPEPEPGWA